MARFYLRTGVFVSFAIYYCLFADIVYDNQSDNTEIQTE